MGTGKRIRPIHIPLAVSFSGVDTSTVPYLVSCRGMSVLYNK